MPSASWSPRSGSVRSARPSRRRPARLRTIIGVETSPPGWRYIVGHPGLRALFWNSALFGGCLMLAAPLTAVLMLRDLGLTPWQYGLALGIPGLGGILGSLCTRRLTRRVGGRTVLLTSGVLRTLWLGFIAIAPSGVAGLLVIIAADFLPLFSAGVFNPTFVTDRMGATHDSHMSRVTTAWSISSKTFQPLFIVAGGVLAVATSNRCGASSRPTGTSWRLIV